MLNLNIANLITVSRIVLVPAFVWLHHSSLTHIEKGISLALLFLLLSLTDWLDGFLARKLKLETPLGRFLDPVADKILVIAALIILLEMKMLNTVVVLILILREVVVSAFRSWLAERSQKEQTQVNYIGKLKTATQMISITMFFLYIPLLQTYTYIAGYWMMAANLLIYAACLFSLSSMVMYMRKAF